MDQIAVCFPPETLAFLKRTAEREFRTVGAQIRFMIEDAAKRAGNAPPVSAKQVAREAWPPPLPVVTKDNLADVKLKVLEMEAERDALARREHSTGGDALYPHHQDRLSFLRSRIEALQPHIKAIERLMGVRT